MSSEEGNFVAARLEDGEDFLKKIGEIADKHRIRSGFFVSCIGMWRDTELGFFDLKLKKYFKKSFKKPLELLSLQGNIGEKDNGERVVHCHVVLGDTKYRPIGGHFGKATVHVGNEILILRLSKVKIRRRLEKTSLYGMRV
jgi:hypothetical protein